MQKNKENEDILQKLITGLKNAPEIEYKKGAWERFKVQEKNGQKSNRGSLGWIAAAASVLITFGLAFYFLNTTDSPKVDEIVTSIHSDPQDIPQEKAEESLSDLSIDREEEEDSRGQSEKTTETLAELNSGREQKIINNLPDMAGNTQRIEILTNWKEGDKSKPLSLTYKNVPLAEIKLTEIEKKTLTKKPVSIENMTLAMESYGQTQVQSGKEPLVTDKAEFSFSQRFQFGAFVSPVRTENKLNFGGGLLFGFDISPRLTVRTGLAFSQYEVSQMKNPNVDKEAGRLQNSISKDGFEKSAAADGGDMLNRQIMVPNINSVTSKVQSFEIPLEFQYNMGAGFYASGGASYAKVYNQRRYAHYQEIERISLEGNTQEIKRINKTVVSAEKNISNQNFGGFVNLSLGKEIGLKNNRFSLSVEPYFKLPIGEFKHTDLNYTNGGVRIITNFR